MCDATETHACENRCDLCNGRSLGTLFFDGWGTPVLFACRVCDPANFVYCTQVGYVAPPKPAGQLDLFAKG